jgi:hypothetical protein
MRHLASRGVLAVLTAFLGLTTIVGATLVVPTLPRLPWGLGQMTTSLMTAGTCRRAARGRS